MEYKVGDKVKVKKDLKAGTTLGSNAFIDSMEKYRGKIGIIKETGCSDYHLDVDNGAYGWTDEMFEPVKASKKTGKEMNGFEAIATVLKNPKLEFTWELQENWYTFEEYKKQYSGFYTSKLTGSSFQVRKRKDPLEDCVKEIKKTWVKNSKLIYNMGRVKTVLEKHWPEKHHI